MHETRGNTTRQQEAAKSALPQAGAAFLESLLGPSATDGLGEADIFKIAKDLATMAGVESSNVSVVLQCTLYGMSADVISSQLSLPRTKVKKIIADVSRSIRAVEQVTPTMALGYVQAPVVASPEAGTAATTETVVRDRVVAPSQIGAVAIDGSRWSADEVTPEPAVLREAEEAPLIVEEETTPPVELPTVAALPKPVFNYVLPGSIEHDRIPEEPVMRNRLRGAIRRELRRREADHMADLSDPTLDQLLDETWGEEGALRYRNYLAHAVADPGDAQLREMIVTTPDRIAAYLTDDAASPRAMPEASHAVTEYEQPSADELFALPAHLALLAPEQRHRLIEAFLPSVPMSEQAQWRHTLRQWCDGEDPREYVTRRQLSGVLTDRLMRFSVMAAKRIVAKRKSV